MSKRLRMAKRLLSDKGVIFISIDDNEQANLKLLCDEVFGENNFVGEIIWESATDNNPTQISIDHEYIICYSKNFEKLNKWNVTSEKALLIKSKYEEIKLKVGNDISLIRKQLMIWINSLKKTNDIDLSGVSHYNYVDEKGVFYPGNSSNTKPGDYIYDIIHPKTGKVCAKPTNGYRWPYSTFLEADSIGDVMWGEDETTIPKIKKRIETATELLKSYYYEDGRASSKALENIFGKKVFNNPKPIRLIKKLLRFTSNPSSTILDFFAGSGTTLHATMQLNAEDGGNRQCIMVNITEASDKEPDKNICRDVTYERNRRVIQGYTTPKGDKVEGLAHNNLRYYRVSSDEVSRSGDTVNLRKLAMYAIDMLCIKEDIYDKQEMLGEMATNFGVQYYESNGRGMLVVLDTDEISAVVEQLKAMQPQQAISVYVFASGTYAYDDEFAAVADKVQLCALPEAIASVYRRVLPLDDSGTTSSTNLQNTQE